jgi:hypothetical protein
MTCIHEALGPCRWIFLLQAMVPQRYGLTREDLGEGEGGDGEGAEDGWGGMSELFKIRWLRIVVDEGHTLGSLSITHEGACVRVVMLMRRSRSPGARLAPFASSSACAKQGPPNV